MRLKKLKVFYMNLTINTKFFVVFFSLFIMISCKEEQKKEDTQPVKWTKEKSSDFGKSLAEEDKIAIKIYLKTRPNWEMKQTGTGLRYWIYESSDDTLKPVPGNTVDVSFEVRLLNDSLCYKTEEHEVSTFLVDKSNVETGVQEAVKLMSRGDKAKLIIPHHLGHGLVGDMDKIPPLQVLVVDLHLIEIR